MPTNNKAKRFKPFECSICGELIEETPPCNARPINDGSCCPRCDDLIVNTMRIAMMEGVDGCPQFLTIIKTCIKAHHEMVKLRRIIKERSQ